MPDTERLKRSLRRAARQLDALAADLGRVDVEALSGDEWLRVRAHIGTLTADFQDAVGEVDDLLGTTGGQARILRYLQLRLGEKVTKEELSGVAGIFEWARRVRELRMDHGWNIQSSVTRDDLRVGEYVLMLDHPDEALARRWSTARNIRNLRTAGGAAPPRVRLLEYMRAIYPQSADVEQLAFVAGSTSSLSRCLVELADEGWSVVPAPEKELETAREYRLASLERQA